jgi:hypothetical protein
MRHTKHRALLTAAAAAVITTSAAVAASRDQNHQKPRDRSARQVRAFDPGVANEPEHFGTTGWWIGSRLPLLLIASRPRSAKFRALAARHLLVAQSAVV